jgi:LuxR family transcriptional regulator, quorum-sensing system regulator BjaR1
MSAVDYGREALDFIEGLEAYNRVPDAMDALETRHLVASASRPSL